MNNLIIKILIFLIVVYIIDPTKSLKNIIHSAIYFISDHKKICGVIFLCITLIVSISYKKTLESVEYRRFDSEGLSGYVNFKPVKNELSYSYEDSVELISFSAINELIDILLSSGFSLTLEKANDVYNISSNANYFIKDSGSFLIPNKAGFLVVDGISDKPIFYGYIMHYTIIFDKYDCFNSVLFFIYKDSAVKIECFRGWDIAADITLYKSVTKN